MQGDDQLLHETRVRTRQAVLAGVAGVLLMAAAVLQLSGPHAKVDELTLDLVVAHKRFPIDVIGSVINACGLGAVAATLSFLYGCTSARKPDVSNLARLAAIIGASVAAISGIGYAVVIAVKGHDFVSHGTQTYEQAHKLTTSGILVALPFIGQAAALALAVGFVLIALNAMRAGLLTRFMGYLGIFTGVLVIFPIGSPVPVVQGFWLLALAYLFTGRWPTGVPPAWRSGKAEPWPKSASMREQRAKSAGGGGGGGGGWRGKPAPKPAPDPAPEAVGASNARGTRSTTPKRKRKRRK